MASDQEWPVPHDTIWDMSTGSLGDMEAREEAQATETGLPQQEAAAPEPEASGEPEPLSPSSPGESGGGRGGLGFGTLSYPTPSFVFTCDVTGASPSEFPHL